MLIKYIRSYSPCLGLETVSSSRNPRTRHAAVTTDTLAKEQKQYQSQMDTNLDHLNPVPNPTAHFNIIPHFPFFHVPRDFSIKIPRAYLVFFPFSFHNNDWVKCQFRG
jgi:hypothetical protein